MECSRSFCPPGTTLNNNNNNIKEDELKENEDLNKLGNRMKTKSNSLIYSLEDENIDFVKKEKFQNYLEKKKSISKF